MRHAVRGVVPVLCMPYRENLAIDLDALAREIDYLFDTGADGCALALVSDTLRLTAAERLTIPAHLVKCAAGRGPVVISVGAESSFQAQEFARAAAAAGASALMAIPPLSVALGEAELRRYFEALLDAAPLPLLIQDASSYVGRAMTVEFQAALFRDHGDRIMFKPEAAPLGPTISALLRQTGGQAPIFEGSGGILLVDAYRRGIRGTMPGVELLDGIVALWRALAQADESRIYTLYFPICALVALQLQGGLDGFIAVERYLLHRRGIFPTQASRGPAGYALDAATVAEIDRLYGRLQAALGGSAGA